MAVTCFCEPCDVALPAFVVIIELAGMCSQLSESGHRLSHFMRVSDCVNNAFCAHTLECTCCLWRMQVHKTPLVAVLSTGDEVVEPTTQNLQPGQIRDANRAMLVAACKQAGAQVVDLGIARDTEGHVDACLEKAISQQADVLVTTGIVRHLCSSQACCALGHVDHQADSMHELT